MMLIFGIILGVLALIFIAQNVDIVSYQFLLWTVSAPRFLVFLIILAIGWLLGWSFHLLRKKRKK